MKELSVEEKAKRYDEAIIRGSRLWESDMITRENYEYIFPEVKEDEDERIRKALIDYFRWNPNGQLLNEFTNREVFAWLEKQGKNNMGISEATKQKLEDNLNKALEKETPESLNKFLDEQGEQEHVIAPKFDIGDTIMNKITNEVFTITDRCISLEYYHDINHLHEIKFSEQDNWELVEQKSAWSEEDEEILNLIIARLHSHPNVEVEEYGKDYHWLKSLKERYTWKPSDEQMDMLKIAVSTSNSIVLDSLYYDLKKLKG